MNDELTRTYTRTYLNSTHYPPFVQQADMHRDGVEVVQERLRRLGSHKEYSAYAWHTLMGESEAARKVLDELLVVIGSLIYQAHRPLWNAIAAQAVEPVSDRPGGRGALEAKAREIESLRNLACARLWEILPALFQQAKIPFDEITGRALIKQLRACAGEGRPLSGAAPGESGVSSTLKNSKE